MMEFYYKVVVCDLDGTLLRGDHTIGEFTNRVLHELHFRHGVKIVIASGRHYRDVKGICDEFQFPCFKITSNGARVYDDHHQDDGDSRHQAMYHTNVDKDVATDILELFRNHDNTVVNLFTSDEWLRDRGDPNVGQDMFNLSGFVPIEIGFPGMVRAVQRDDTAKMFFTSADHTFLRTKEDEIHERFGDHVTCTFSNLNSLEITAKNICKATSLDIVLAKLSHSTSDCLAFGDGMNDLELLQSVHKGIIMGNADPRIKGLLATHEIIGTNDDEAVASYLHECFNLQTPIQ